MLFLLVVVMGSKVSTPPPKQHQTAKQLATASKVRLVPFLASTLALQVDSQASAVSVFLTRSAPAPTAKASSERIGYGSSSANRKEKL